MEILSGVITIINILLIILLYCIIENKIKHKNEIISKQEEEIEELINDYNQAVSNYYKLQERLDDALEKFEEYKKNTETKAEVKKTVKRTRKAVAKEDK